MRPNPLKARLANGETAYGTMVFEFLSPGLPQILEGAGAEFVFFDMEHSGFSYAEVKTQLALCRGLDIVPLVRPRATTHEHTAQLLDLGAMGILFQMVETAEQAEELVRLTTYPPHGQRGAMFGGAHDDYSSQPVPDIIDGATDGLQSSNGQSTTAETSDDDDDGDPAGDFLTVSDTVTLDHGTEATDEAGDLNDPTDEAAETAANAATSNHDDDDSNLEVDLGLTPIPTYRIGSLVWEDFDNDGIAETGEPGIEGVLVQLIDENGDVIAETVTDSDGEYVFDDLPAGDYQVVLPADQEPELGDQPDIIADVLDGLNTSGTPEAAADNDVDNDNNGVDTAEGLTSGVITLGEGDTKDEPTGEVDRVDSATSDEDSTIRDDRSNQTVDFGLFRGLRLGNQVFLDGEQGEPGYNNGVFDTGETGISGVTVELWEDDGDGVFDPETDTLISTTPTDSEGNYSFGNVEPDTPCWLRRRDLGDHLG